MAHFGWDSGELKRAAYSNIASIWLILYKKMNVFFFLLRSESDLQVPAYEQIIEGRRPSRVDNY